MQSRAYRFCICLVLAALLAAGLVGPSVSSVRRGSDNPATTTAYGAASTTRAQGEYTDTKTEGVYQCRACGAELFRSTEKFESHCGWPSFFDPADSQAVVLRPDDSPGMRRVEVLCANCHSHLGHVFEGEGYPTPTDQRYCINSISLRLKAAD